MNESNTNQILNKIDIINQFPELEAIDKGERYLLKCPNCAEQEAFMYKTGTMKIICNRKNNCQYETSLWDYIKEKHNLSDNSEIFKLISKLAGNHNEHHNHREENVITDNPEKIKIYEKAQEFFTDKLWTCAEEIIEQDKTSIKNERALSIFAYLRSERKYSDEEIKKMGIGFYYGTTGLSGFLKKEGFGKDFIEESGLKRDDFNKTFFLTIPYHNRYGKIIGFITRSLEDTTSKIKYNSTAGLKKTENLFNLHTIKNKNLDTLIMVEGYFDALIMTARGIGGVVAIGQASTSEQYIDDAVKSGIKYFILAFDNDEAGKNNTKKSIELINKKGYSSFVVQLPEEFKDPDEFMREKGIKKLKKLLENPIGGYKWLTNQIISNCDTTKDIDKEKFLQNISEIEAIINNPVSKKELWETVSSHLNIEKKELELLVQDKRNKIRIENICKDISTKTIDLINRNKYSEAKEYINKKNTELINFTDNHEKLLKAQYNFDEFIKKHNELLSRAGVKTGFPVIDKNFSFNLTDFNIIQAMSNHGKTTFMLNLMYNFLKKEKNITCVFISYEASIERVLERFLNVISNKNNEDFIVKYTDGKYSYAKLSNVPESKKQYDKWISNGNLQFQSSIPYESLSYIISSIKTDYPNNIIILFLDYIQIIRNNFKSDGWQKIKELAYGLEGLAVDNEIIIFTGCQVNEKGDTREGKDIYNAATNVIDIFNHSHSKLEKNKDGKFVEKEHNKSIISISIDKSKFFDTKTFSKLFHFNGYVFEQSTQSYKELIKEKTSISDGENYLIGS